MLFDAKTKEHLAVIDLDTVMPGLIAFDFGDAIRIVGSKGEIKGRCESNQFKCIQYVHNGDEYKTYTKEIDLTEEVGGSGHSNGDYCLMYDYVRYLNGDKSSISITSIEDSVNGHKCVYASETSRKDGVIVRFD